jgi:hypothetical protein
MKYLVELSHSHLPADYILSEMHLEFGRAPQATGDPDILKLRLDNGHILVLCDYDNNRVWITIETPDDRSYHEVCERIEILLARSHRAGKVQWSQIEV